MVIMTCYLCNEVIQNGERVLETRDEADTLYGCVHEYCFRDAEVSNSSYEPPSDAVSLWEKLTEIDPEEQFWKRMVREKERVNIVRTFGEGGGAMKNLTLGGGLVEICPGSCTHRLCNDARLYAKLGINPFGTYENNSERPHIHLERRNPEQGHRSAQ